MALPDGLDVLSESWVWGRDDLNASLACPVVFYEPSILTARVERHAVLTIYPSMGLVAYGGKLHWFRQARSLGESPWHYAGHTVTFIEVVSVTKTVALAHMVDDLENAYPAHPRHPLFAGYRAPLPLHVFFGYDADAPSAGLWLEFERKFFARYLLCRLQRRVRAWLQRRRAWRLGFCALVVDADRRTISAQRAVFGVPELRALVVRFLKGQ